MILVLMALLALPPVSGQSEQEYYEAAGSFLVEAEAHLFNATEALSRCLASSSTCAADRSPTIRSLNDSRVGLIRVRDSFSSLIVPARYQVANGLILRGLTDCIDGIFLQMEGLDGPSLEKFDAGSESIHTGRKELNEGVDLLNAMPPGSSWETLLWVAAIGLVVFVGASSFLFLRWYRKQPRQALGSHRGERGP